MFKFGKDKKPRVSITVASFGTLYQDKVDNETFWFGHILNVVPGIKVELRINTMNGQKPSIEQINSVEKLIAESKIIMNLLLTHLREAFIDIPPSKTLDELQEMYFLASIELKVSNEWWLVLEPVYNVETPFNFFPRFTLKYDKIVWSNVN